MAPVPDVPPPPPRYRLQLRLQGVAGVRIEGKMNGAVGSFNAHVVAYPKVWLRRRCVWVACNCWAA